MQSKSDFDAAHRNRNDAGKVSFQGILMLLVVIGIVWGALSLFPLVSTSADLENAVKDAADDWLRLLPREQTQQLRRQTIDEIRGVIVEKLENHTWDKKQLEIIVESRNVYVRLPYTLNVNLFGFELTFDKKLDVHQQAITF